MEMQMKAICEGRSTRNDVVQQNLEQYRAVFTRTQQQINVLKAVSCWRNIDGHVHVW
jgi:DNA topoisomerase-3